MRGNRSVSRALDILEFLMKSPDGVTLATLSKELNIPKTSVFDILVSLVDRGCVELMSEGTKVYRLGYKSFQVGYAYLQSVNIQTISKPLLQAIVKKTNKTAFAAMLRGNQVVYLDKHEPESSFYLRANVGSLEPAHSTGLGKAMLAVYSDEQVMHMLGPGPYTRVTTNTITDIKNLLEDLRTCRKQGYAIDKAENEDQIWCFAAPVLDHQGKLVGAISLSSLRLNYTKEDLEYCPLLIHRTALKISNIIGYQGSQLYNFQSSER